MPKFTPEQIEELKKNATCPVCGKYSEGAHKILADGTPGSLSFDCLSKHSQWYCSTAHCRQHGHSPRELTGEPVLNDDAIIVFQ